MLFRIVKGRYKWSIPTILQRKHFSNQLKFTEANIFMQAFSLCIDEINYLDENSKTCRKIITLSVKLNTKLFS